MSNSLSQKEIDKLLADLGPLGGKSPSPPIKKDIRLIKPLEKIKSNFVYKSTRPDQDMTYICGGCNKEMIKNKLIRFNGITYTAWCSTCGQTIIC